jgi:hypothetical protein
VGSSADTTAGKIEQMANMQKNWTDAASVSFAEGLVGQFNEVSGAALGTADNVQIAISKLGELAGAAAGTFLGNVGYLFSEDNPDALTGRADALLAEGQLNQTERDQLQETIIGNTALAVSKIEYHEGQLEDQRRRLENLETQGDAWQRTGFGFAEPQVNGQFAIPGYAQEGFVNPYAYTTQAQAIMAGGGYNDYAYQGGDFDFSDLPGADIGGRRYYGGGGGGSESHVYEGPVTQNIQFTSELTVNGNVGIDDLMDQIEELFSELLTEQGLNQPTG